MSFVTSMEAVKEWVEKEICSKVQLKQPDDKKNVETYPYKLVNPVAYAMFVPTKDRLPPDGPSPIPSICVRLKSGTDDVKGSERKLRFQLMLSAWDPGTHAKDIIMPKGGANVPPPAFQPDAEGWRDIWNFVDIVLQELRNADYIGSEKNRIRIQKEDLLEWGPLTEDEAIRDYYPYWFTWVEFNAAEVLSSTRKDVEQFL